MVVSQSFSEAPQESFNLYILSLSVVVREILATLPHIICFCDRISFLI